MSLFAELKRRNVFRVTIAYVIGAWLVLQVVDVVLNNITAPGWIFQVMLLLLALGLPFVVVFSWVYELTPDGLKKESEISHADSVVASTAKKLDTVVIILLVVTIGVFLADRLLPERDKDDEAARVVQTESRTEEVPIVAVLPLKALSTEDEGTFLAAGLHDDLLTRLARLAAFRVISRTSVMEYANTSKNLRQIGAELGAGYILEGALQAIGGRVRINAQLIDAATDEHLWAETFDRPLTTANLFEVQAEIAEAIAGALHSTLSPLDKNAMREVSTESLDAYRAYLQGKAHYESLSRPSIDAMIGGARSAVELDPTFADAWALLAQALIRDYWESGAELDATPDEALRQAAREALEQAQALNADGVNTLLATAYYRYYGFRDYLAALIVLGRAEAAAPYNADVLALRGYLLRRLGRLSEAADALMESRKADPNSAGFFRETITTLRSAGRCEEAKDLGGMALNRFPDDNGVLQGVAMTLQVCENDIRRSTALVKRVNITSPYELDSVVFTLTNGGDYRAAINALNSVQGDWVQTPITQLTIGNSLAWLLRRTGQPDSAEAALRDASDATKYLTHVGATALAQMAMTAALRGDTAETLILGRRTMESVPDDAYLRPTFRYNVVKAYSVAGLTEEALQQLEIMLGEPGGRYVMPFRLDPYLESLRDSPKFQLLVP
jgi:TolB-like protein/Tfp pilus assembly protein PilF